MVAAGENLAMVAAVVEILVTAAVLLLLLVVVVVVAAVVVTAAAVIEDRAPTQKVAGGLGGPKDSGKRPLSRLEKLK
jgi:hypothetical protein